MEDLKQRLSDFYNSFNEEKRLDHRHGVVELSTSLAYIRRYLQKGDRIIDIGAGRGRYSFILKDEGYDVTALELVRPNIGIIHARDRDISVIEGDARDLSMFDDASFDIGIVFGPMYHLPDQKERLKALKEAARICRRYLFVAYLMNDYSVIQYAFIEDNYRDIKDKLDEDYHIRDKDALFFQVRIEDIDELNEKAGLRSVCRFAQDGPSDYIRSVLNRMDGETFAAFIDYHLKTCERKELLGASSHVVDIIEL